MKHKKIWISTMIIFLILIGMISFLPKILFLKAMNDFIHLDSIHIEGNLTLSTFDYDLKLKGSANYTKDILYSTLTTDSKWYPIRLEFYSLFSPEEMGIYLSTNLIHDWYSIKNKLGNENGSKNISFKEIKIKKVKSDRKYEQKFQLKVSREIFLSFISKYFPNADLENDTITLFFYMKKGKITGLKWKENNGFYFSKNSNILLKDLDFNFSSWNSISNISIPVNIVENSKKIEKNILEILFS